MSPIELARSLTRRWPVLVILLALSVVAVATMPQRGVWWSRVSVVFLPTEVPKLSGNILQGPDPSIVFFAAAVERAVGGVDRSPRLSSTGATLYGAGIRRGYTLSLVNSGGQWQSNFNRPTIVVEVVDSDAARTQRTVDELVAQVQDTAAELQSRAGASRAETVRTELAPKVPEVTWVGGNPKRAEAMGALVGVIGSVGLTAVVDQVLAIRRRRR